MIKTIFFILLKILGIGVIIVLLILAKAFYQYQYQKSGYKVGWKNVYFYTKYRFEIKKDKVEGADTKTFEVLESPGHYAKDKHRVYYKFHPLEESDPKTFSTDSLFGINFLCRDQQSIYFENKLVSRDADHFTRIDKYYFKDTKYIYRARYGHKDIDLKGFDIIEEVDQSTFQALEFPYCRDKNHVFFKKHKLTKLNPDKVKLLIDELGFYYFAMDDKVVYFYENLLPNADPATLVRVKPSWWKDKKQVYHWGKVLPSANPKTFEPVKNHLGNAYFYSKDDRHVYYKATKLEGVNPSTFREVKKGEWTDGAFRFDGNGKEIHKK